MCKYRKTNKPVTKAATQKQIHAFNRTKLGDLLGN